MIYEGGGMKETSAPRRRQSLFKDHGKRLENIILSYTQSKICTDM